MPLNSQRELNCWTSLAYDTSRFEERCSNFTDVIITQSFGSCRKKLGKLAFKICSAELPFMSQLLLSGIDHILNVFPQSFPTVVINGISINLLMDYLEMQINL